MLDGSRPPHQVIPIWPKAFGFRSLQQRWATPESRFRTHAMVRIDAKQLWQPALALLVATALVVFILPDSRANRISRLDLEEAGFGELYIQFLNSERTRASLVVERGVTTVRRGELPSSEPEWSMERLSGGGWLARSPEEGVLFLIPVSEVSDWVYPFIYSFVRERRRGMELPRVEWTTLYVDRLYRGLFLRVKLPFDRPESSDRRELLAVESSRVTHIDTWFEEPAIGLSALTELEIDPPHVSLAWLSALRSETATLLILSRRPLELELMPLPISVPGLFTAAYGTEPTVHEDEHALRWNESWRADLADTTSLAEQEVESLESEFEEYRALFLSALRIHGEFHGVADELQAYLPGRQSAGLGLGLALEGN